MAGEIQTDQVIADVLPALHSDTTGNLTWWTAADLLEWIDEAAKALSRAALLFAERDTSITTAGGTSTYPLPSRHNATLHVSLATSPLRPANVIELEALDPDWQTNEGVPLRWYEDTLMDEIGVAPVPAGSAALPIIASVWPPDLVDSQELQAPAPVEGYLAFAVLAAAYGREGESEQPDLAQHCRERCRLYEEVFRQYYGPGI